MQVTSLTRTLSLLAGLLLAWLLPVMLLAGCGKPPMLVHQYILDYPEPPSPGAPLPDALKVERFAVAQAFNSTDMVYRPDPYRSGTYTYNRWRVNPGYLVTDYLLRDFRAARLFKGVFGPDAANGSRFRLEGGVEEFQEVDGPDGWKAALALTVTLLDLNYQEVPRRVVFQKNYRVQEPLTAKSPAGLAQGMSQAMERLSAEILRDVYRAAQSRRAVPGK